MTRDAPRNAAHAAARRAVARRLHPDLGGDPQEYLAAMERVDRQFGTTSSGGLRQAASAPPYVVRRSSSLSSVQKGTRGAVRAIRGVLPRGWPGARRYGRL